MPEAGSSKLILGLGRMDHTLKAMVKRSEGCVCVCGGGGGGGGLLSLRHSLAISTFSPIGLLSSNGLTVCVCVCVCVCVDGCGIFTYISSFRTVPVYTRKRTHASSNHLRTANRRGQKWTLPDTDKGAGWAKGWRGRYLHQNKRLYSVSTHKYGERHTEHSVHN